MPGPKTPVAALEWIQKAVYDGRYHVSIHFRDMLYSRKIEMEDACHAIEVATVCEPYDRDPVHGGTCWRIKAHDIGETKEVWVGCEAFYESKKRKCMLCTLFDPNADRR